MINELKYNALSFISFNVFLYLRLLTIFFAGFMLAGCNKNTNENQHQKINSFKTWVPLTKSGDFDTKGWLIDFSKLSTPKRGVHPFIFVNDYFYESSDEKYACLMYTTIEPNMGSYIGLIGIFENKQEAKLLINPKNQWFTWLGESTLQFNSNFMMLRLQAYNDDNNISGTPFVVINLEYKQFGFVDFDFTSRYYSLIHLKDMKYLINLDEPEELAISQKPNRHGETIDFGNIKFYSFDKFDNALEIYLLEKKNKTL